MTGREFHPMSGKPFAVLAALFAGAFIAQAADLTGSDSVLFDQVSEWVIDYQVGSSIPAGWRADAPGDRIRLVDRHGAKAVQIRNINPGHALFTYIDPKVFDKLTGTVLVEIELAFPRKLLDSTATHQFCFCFAAGTNPVAQLVVGLSEHNVYGTITGTYPEAPRGKFFRVRMALDTATGTQAVWINGQKLFKADAKPLNDKKSVLCFGDDGNAVSGVFELKSLRITALRETPGTEKK